MYSSGLLTLSSPARIGEGPAKEAHGGILLVGLTQDIEGGVTLLLAMMTTDSVS
jgi:hypothetical protein